MVSKRIVKRLDDKLDLDSAFTDKIPSIVSMNQGQGQGTGDPALAGAPGGGADNANKAVALWFGRCCTNRRAVTSNFFTVC